MKKNYLLLPLFLGLLCIVSCNLYIMKLSHDDVELDGNAQTFTIRANHPVMQIFIHKPKYTGDNPEQQYGPFFDDEKPMMYCQGEWFRVEVSKEEGDRNIKVILDENRTGETRWLEINATYNEKDANCLITQKSL